MPRTVFGLSRRPLRPRVASSSRYRFSTSRGASDWSGQSVDEAAWWFVTMARSCQAQLLAEAVGTPKLIAAAGARAIREQTGFPLAGWFSFQPLWDETIRTDPDLFD
jgi:hypothetical protein